MSETRDRAGYPEREPYIRRMGAALVGGDLALVDEIEREMRRDLGLPSRPPVPSFEEQCLRSHASEPLWYLRSIPYQRYSMSQHWRQLREQLLQERGRRCQVCGFSRIEEPWIGSPDLPISHGDVPLQIHHLSYIRLGEELQRDLLVVCEPCNYTISRPGAESSQFWMACADGSRVGRDVKQRRLALLQRLEKHQKEHGQLDDVEGFFRGLGVDSPWTAVQSTGGHEYYSWPGVDRGRGNGPDVDR